MNVLLRGTALATSMAFFSSVTALAASPDGTSSSVAAASDQLETVVVTANKRAENIKDVPVSISVVGGEALEENHITSADDLTRNAPGISFTEGGGSGNAGVGAANFEIRGIASSVGAATVGVYLDEVPVTLLNQSGAFTPKFFDFDRVEVLRGPQGTLYGASSEGGTVRFLTNQPNLDQYEVDGTGDVSGTEHGGVNTDDRAVVNIPIVPGEFAIRFGAEWTLQSGWIDQYAHQPGNLAARTDQLLDSGANTERDQVFKFSAKWQPEPDFTITPSILYQREYQDDSPVFYLGEGLYNESSSIHQYAKDVDVIPSLTVDKGVGIGTLTSISSYFYRDYERGRDGTYYDPDIVVPYYLDTAAAPYTTAGKAGIADTTLATLPTTATDSERIRVVNEEIRLTSPSKQDSGLPFTWVIGGFYSNTTDYYNHNEYAPGWNALFEKIYGFSPSDQALSPIADYLDPSDNSLWAGDRFYYDISKRGVAQYASFGQTDFDILPDLHGEVGLRYQYSNLTYSRQGGGWWDLGDIHNASGDARDYALTPKFSLTYDLSPNANIYATASKGYRDGGVNTPVPQALCGPYEKAAGIASSPPSYGPDKLWSYELGTKGTVLDNTLSYSADVYYIQWSNVQQQILIPVCAFDYISNVGDAEAYGSEAQVDYKVPFVHGLTVSGNASVEHAVITSSSGNGAAAVGEKLLFTPDWTAVLSANYSFPVGGEGMTGFVRTDYDWIGRSHGDFIRDATDFTNKQYGVLNGSIGVLTESGFEVQLYGKNLANDSTIIKSPTIADVTEAYTVMPLTVGLKVSKQFIIPTSTAPEVAPVQPVPPPAPPAPPAPAPEIQRSFQVFFDFDKSTVTDAAAAVIKAAAAAIKAGNVVQITVTGHTDTVGSAKYNQALSERRAASVKSALIAEGVASGEITTLGVGKTGLLVPTADGVREPQNRRAEIVLQ